MGKIDDLIEEARKGSADAMMSLGCAYADGQIVPHDYSQAVTWFERALRLGKLDALLELAVAYEYGLGHDRDNDEAFELYMRAAGFLKSPFPFAIRGHVLTKNLCSHDHKGILALADAGYAHAMYYLADKDYEDQNYYEKRDRYEKWMSKAAELDYPLAVVAFAYPFSYHYKNPPSQLERLNRDLAAFKYHPPTALSISDYYEHGWGVEPNKVLAAKWKKAWDEQHLEKIKWDLISGDSVSGLLADKLFEEDTKYLEIAAMHGSSSAYLQLTYFYLNGAYSNLTDVPKDKAKAIDFFIKTCNQSISATHDGLPPTFYWSVKFIAEGHLDNLDDVELLDWFQKITVSYQDYSGPMNHGFRTNKLLDDKIIEWQKARIGRLMKSQSELLKKKVENGNAEAQFYYSYNFKRYKKRAGNCLKWLLKSAEQGFVNAQYRVGLCYAKGDGAPIDSRECLKWLLKAAMQGQTEAQRELVRLYCGHFLRTGGDPLKEDPIDIKDYVEALAWDIVSCDYTGRLDFYKDDKEKLSADDLAKAYRRAKEIKAAISSL
jgi:TPR repeat protein